MAVTGALEQELGSLLGGYRIDELIGRGGTGVTYRATDVASGRIYALKALSPELADDERFRERFRREMLVAASLHHPNVLPIHYAGEVQEYHAGEVQRVLIVVSDFVSGTTLHEVIRRYGPLEVDRAVALLTQIAGALDAAHWRGLMHGDVKPENVLITVRDGVEHAYLTGFGLANKVDTTSPEQTNGALTGARTAVDADISALGWTFYQMLVHGGENRLKKYPELEAVDEKATGDDPEGRYFSAGDFARDAAAALSARRQPGAVRWVFLAGALCLAAAIAADLLVPTFTSASPGKSFTATASAVPTNRVTGGGTATILLNGDVATVTVHTHGLANQLHWMHIHGGTGACPTASAAERTAGHLFISAEAGDAVYGPPVTSLTTSGDTSARSHLDPTRYQTTGDINYRRTITLDAATAREIRTGRAAIVVHGITYDGRRVYDNSLGPGAERAAPALCGVLGPGRSTTADGHPSPVSVYTASLRPYPNSEAR